jgi:hypothetical protein
MGVTKTATESAPASENTKLLYFGAIGKGHGRENLKILMDQERTESSTVLTFKINVFGKETRDASYLVRADCPTKPNDKGTVLGLSKLRPGEIEESWAIPLCGFTSEPGFRSSIAKDSAKPLNRLRSTLRLLHTTHTNRVTRETLDQLNLLVAGAISSDSKVFRLRRT